MTSTGEVYGRHECGGTLVVLDQITDTLLELECERCKQQMGGRVRGAQPTSSRPDKPDYFEDF